MAFRISPIRARQGSKGMRVLVILLGSLVLALMAWFAAEIYGVSNSRHGSPVDNGALTQQR
ncbi:MAG TPA: hypothetical protein VGU72_09110 [Beijerinckiaceae bacterium]|nr:hypothetical protein [Beijerinckiaceae bacterium]